MAPPPAQAPAETPARPSRLLVAAAALLVAAAVLVVYRGALENGWVRYDDDVYVTDNPRVQSLSAENLRWMLRDTSVFYWHPLTWLVHALEVQAFGQEARWHHLTSVLLHAANATLVLLLFLAVAEAAGAAWPPGARVGGAAAAALLWALHPLRVESVAWAAEKKDLLVALFMLAGMLAWLRYGRLAAGAPGRRRWYAAALAATALGLLAKPMAMTMPFLLLALDAWPLRRLSGPGALRRALLEKVPFLALAAAAVIPSALDPRQERLLPTGTGVDLGARLVGSIWGFAFGAVRTAWPADLVPFYPLPLAADVTLGNPRYLLAGLLLATATALAWASRRRRPAAAAAWAFFLLATAPVCGIRQAGSIETADRFTYLPTVGLFLLAGAGVATALALRPAVAAAAAVLALALAAVLGSLAVRQVRVWHDAETLWTRIATAFPGRVVVAHNNLGALWHHRAVETGDPAALARAEEEYRTAIRLREDHAPGHGNLGMVLQARGDLAGAERCYRRALELDPRLGRTHANLAILLARRGDLAEAREEARRARASPQPVPEPLLQAVDRAIAAGK
jgi:tetratricopeptide (TPR) repeat protein